GGSRDMSSSLIFHPENAPDPNNCSLGPLDPDAPVPSNNLYRRNFAQVPSFDLMNTEGSGGIVETAVADPNAINTSDDLGHVVYTTPLEQTADAPATSTNKVYDVQDKTNIHLVSIDANGAKFTTPSALPFGQQRLRTLANVVSANGDRIFFQNPTNSGNFDGCPDIPPTAVGCELYERENDAVTHWVSQSECTSSCGSVGARKPFLAATPDGSKALFESTEKLTDDATASSLDKLYLYTDSANPSTDPNNLTLISKDNEPSNRSA